MYGPNLLALAPFALTFLSMSVHPSAQGAHNAPAGPASVASQPVEALHGLFDDYSRWQRREYPEFAMSKGDYSNADRISDLSIAAIERRHADTQAFLNRLHSIDIDSLGDDDRVSYRCFEHELSLAVAGHRFREFLAPIGGRYGPQQEIPQMGERVRFDTTRDYEHYLARLELVPTMCDQIIERLKLGVREERTPPRITMLGVPSQFEKLLADGGLAPLAEPFDRMPAHVSANVARRLRERFDKTSLPAIRAGLQKLATYVQRQYLPACRDSISAADWPEGEAYYNHQLRVMTTTDLTSREIHDIGSSEVTRLRKEMMTVIRRSDFMDLHEGATALPENELFLEFLNYLRTDPRFYHRTADELLRGYRDICKQVDWWMPRLFKTLPRLPYGVREIPAFMAPDQTTAYYQPGHLDNAQAGAFYANTFALDQRPKYEMIPLALHEAVPGHHHQIALAQEMPNLPEFRRDTYLTAYGEGWALYAESLGKEMGLYEDPYDDFGRLLYEMWRACRLVVDTGIHAFGWDRDRAIRFMMDHTALSKLNIETEVDRYIAWPGQATGYKIGELRIRAMRLKAERELGARFDLRQFHDCILLCGAVPLPVLEQLVDQWIQSRRIPEVYD